MRQEVAIRELRAGDVEAIVAIAVAAWEPIYAHRRQVMGDALFEKLHSDWREGKAAEVRSACARAAGADVCVAEDAGRVAGFITFTSDDATQVGEIGNNAVHPDFQGRGIGTAMYRHVFAKLKERGMRYVKVTTGGDPAHAPARRAYEKAGFSIQLPSVTYYREL
jgi:ribosomal protein S18 acetylase RimI-like enzyme